MWVAEGNEHFPLTNLHSALLVECIDDDWWDTAGSKGWEKGARAAADEQRLIWKEKKYTSMICRKNAIKNQQS